MEIFKKLILTILNLNLFLFPFICVIVIGFGLLESVTYMGFIGNHFLISFSACLIICFLSGIIAGNTFKDNKKNSESIVVKYNFLLNIITLFLPAFVITFTILYSLLSPERDTVVFGSRLLVYPSRVGWVIVLMVFYLLIFNIYFKNNRKIIDFFKKNKYLNLYGDIYKLSVTRKLEFIAIVLLVFIALIKNFILILPQVKFNIKNILHNPLASYDDKMESQIGPVYKYYQFINEYTPVNSVILHPKQQGQWGDVSNEGYTRYFIFPRNLISEDADSPKKQDVDYVMIIGSEKLKFKNGFGGGLQMRWPEFDLPVEELIYYPYDGKSKPIVIKTDKYNFKNNQYNEYWGLAKVDKNKIKW